MDDGRRLSRCQTRHPTSLLRIGAGPFFSSSRKPSTVFTIRFSFPSPAPNPLSHANTIQSTRQDSRRRHHQDLGRSLARKVRRNCNKHDTIDQLGTAPRPFSHQNATHTVPAYGPGLSLSQVFANRNGAAITICMPRYSFACVARPFSRAALAADQCGFASIPWTINIREMTRF